MVVGVVGIDEQDPCPYYDFHDWEVTQNDQVFQQAIAMARHLEVRRRRLEGANENILFDLLRSRLHDPR